MMVAKPACGPAAPLGPGRLDSGPHILEKGAIHLLYFAAQPAPLGTPPRLPPGAAMASGMATVLAKMDALIAAIGKESGFLEKVLS
jgi:hypothetical protein